MYGLDREVEKFFVVESCSGIREWYIVECGTDIVYWFHFFVLREKETTLNDNLSNNIPIARGCLLTGQVEALTTDLLQHCQFVSVKEVGRERSWVNVEIFPNDLLSADMIADMFKSSLENGVLKEWHSAIKMV